MAAQGAPRRLTRIGRLALAASAAALLLGVASEANAQLTHPFTNIPTVRIEPDSTRVIPNTRKMIDQDLGGNADTNFLTDDWGPGRDKFGRKGGVTKDAKKQTGGSNNPVVSFLPPAVSREILVVVEGLPTTAEADALVLKHRLTKLESQNIPFIGATVFRLRIPDNRPSDTVLRALSADVKVSLAQLNHRYITNQAVESQGTQGATARGTPPEYAVAKLHLPEAHRLARGTDVAIAVIDSGIDVSHRELAGSVIGSFDALNSKEGPHPHGTGIAGSIAAHAELTGSAPGARLIAVRAFGVSKTYGAESTSFVVMKAINYAVEQNAQIINMSFAGPRDPLIQRALAAGFARGIVLVAAAGNAGPTSPPLYPAADSNVIAVTAVDGGDRLFPQANRGAHIAVAAPGVDILMPVPHDKYEINSGTSFAAAYVSGLAALLIDRNPGITPAGVRAALTETARDLGPQGRDEQFGAGIVDALAAVQSASRAVTAGAAKSEANPAVVPTAR